MAEMAADWKARPSDKAPIFTVRDRRYYGQLRASVTNDPPEPQVCWTAGGATNRPLLGTGKFAAPDTSHDLISQNSGKGYLNGQAHFYRGGTAKPALSGANLGGVTNCSQFWSGLVGFWRTRQDSNL
ncbi:hypothetical protein HFO45_34445 [Rhizobium leguminosarum]|uniref:hypothetical protein n=1 Tax=Rhizobium leguminosarum TaxID=384 RepID=UPI001C95E34D|nr:hypothetical protein [Rhizobium leguminosarum]MBY5653260.1 hypothetical protein [Rhizobium leguminosarum]